MGSPADPVRVPPSPRGAHRNVSERLVLSFRTPFFLPFRSVAGWTSRVKAEWGLAGHCRPTPAYRQPCSTRHTKAQKLHSLQPCLPHRGLVPPARSLTSPALRHEGQEAVAHPGWTSPPSQELDIPGGPRPALAPVATWSRPCPHSSYLASAGREAWEVGPHSGRHPSQAHSCWTPGAGGLLQHKRDRSSLQSKRTAREVHRAQLGT